MDLEPVRNMIGEGNFFIGFEVTSPPLRRRICVVTEIAETEKIVWDSLCSQYQLKIVLNVLKNPALIAQKRKIAFYVRSCEARGLVEYFKSGLVDRQRLYLHGVKCDGVIDARLLNHVLKESKLEEGVRSAKRENENFIILLDSGKKISIPFEKILLKRCYRCKAPQNFDFDSFEEGARTPAIFRKLQSESELKHEDVKKLFSECILCFACRAACPGCYCKECIFEFKMRNELSPLVYHTVRTYHLAGRCVECGECSRVCPVELPVELIHWKLEEILKTRGKFSGAGIDPQEDIYILGTDYDK